MTHVAVLDAQGRLEDDAATAVVPWWSFTKSLIAVCALRLAERGRLGSTSRCLVCRIPFASSCSLARASATTAA